MRPFVRKSIVLLLALAGAAAIAWSFRARPVEVDLARVDRGPLRATVDEDGRTRIRERYVVSAPLGGRLLRGELKAGDPVVARTTVVVALEPTDPSLLDARARAHAESRVRAAEGAVAQAKTGVDRAREAATFARDEFERRRALVRGGAATGKELEAATLAQRDADLALQAAELAVRVADHDLETARAALIEVGPASDGSPRSRRFEVSSPVGGRVLRVLEESATVVMPGTPILEVGDPTDLEVVVDVLTRDALRVAVGARVLLEGWGGPKALEGRVRRVEPAAFTKVSALGVEEQRVNVLVDLLDPPEAREGLGDGWRVDARIVVWEAPDVIRVPVGAVFRDGETWQTFVVVGGKAAKRPVEVGHDDGLRTEILRGLAPGDEVILHPSDRIRDGTEVVAR